MATTATRRGPKLKAEKEKKVQVIFYIKRKLSKAFKSSVLDTHAKYFENN